MKKNVFIPLIIGLLLILTLQSVVASPALALITTTWTNGLVNISTKSANDASQVNMSYITLRYVASNTRNSTTFNLINITNTTATNFDWGYANFTFGSEFILDDTSSASVTGVSTGIGDSGNVALAATTVIVDQNNPVAPTAVTFSNPVEADETITATIDRDNANRCFIRFGSQGAPRNAMTLSGTTCTFTVTANNPPNSAYQAFVTADDNGADAEALSTAQNIEITATKNDGGGLFGAGATLTMPKDNSIQSALGLSKNPFSPKQKQNALLIVIVIIAIILMRKK